jgi:sugar lactone lactonase YvrE
MHRPTQLSAEIRCVWPGPCELGEGALWVADEQAVWFVDILGQRLHRYQTATKRHDSWPTPARPGFVVGCAPGGMIVGLAKGLYFFSSATQRFELLTQVELERQENRLNDGTVGPDGALWFGSKNEPENAASGAWYRWTGSGEPRRFDDGYVVTNGPAFSVDGCRLYHSDSVRSRVLSRSVSADGRVGENSVFAEIEPGAGYPDGLAVDSEDCIWVALYAGGALRRYGRDGRLLDVVQLPCAHVTRPSFGGADGRTLYVTTASAGLNKDERARQPQAGAIFELRVRVPGPLPRMFNLPAREQA